MGENILYEKSTLLRAIHDEVSLDLYAFCVGFNLISSV